VGQRLLIRMTSSEADGINMNTDKFVMRDHAIFDTEQNAFIGAGDACYKLNELREQLAAEREKREQAERVAQVCYDLHEVLGVKWGDDPYAVISSMRQQLLAATAAIAEHNKIECGHKGVQINADLSALQAHDEAVRKPLVDALDKAKKAMHYVLPVITEDYPLAKQELIMALDALAKVKNL